MRQVIGLSVVFLLVSGGLVQAGEGRVFVWEPGTISAPGHYMLTRDIVVTGEEGIVIAADGVTLDLGGRTISMGDSSINGIRVDLSGVTSPEGEVVIRNGRITGGRTGIFVPGVLPSLEIDNIEITGTTSHGVHVVFSESIAGIIGDVPIVSMKNSLIHEIGGDGVMLADPRPSPLCAILINTNIMTDIDGDGIDLDGCADGVIKDNMIKKFGLADTAAAGIRLAGGDSREAPVVVSNVISHGGIAAAGLVAAPAYQSVGFLFAHNTVKNNGSNGVLIEGGQGRIEDNTISHNGAAGIHLSGGSRTFIDGNYVADNTTYGFYFANNDGHAYRDNFLRGNKTGALGGEPNTDAGGNIE